MGYDLTITRCDPEDDQCSANIGLEEWLEYVRSDREFRLDGFAEAKLSGKEVLRMEAEGLAVWIKYSGHDEEGNKAWFHYFDGEISVKNPDEEIIQKMCSIAEALQANVYGDDGESYPEALSADRSEPPTRTKSADGSRKKGILLWLGACALLGVVGFLIGYFL